MARWLFLVAWLLLGTVALDAQQLQIQVFQLNNRPASSTVEAVRMVLGPQGTVVPDDRTQTLIVKDTPEGLSRVQALLERLDQPLPQVRITVAFSGAAGSSGVAGGAAWDPHTGRVTVGGGAGQGSASTSGQQQLLVMSGEEGRLVVGRDLVQVQPYWIVARDWGLIPPGVVFRQVTTGFLVAPRVVGEAITLVVTPWFSYLGPDGPGDVRFAEAASTVQLRSGQSVNLGSSSVQGSSSRSLFGLILGGGSADRAEAGSMSITARIEPDWSR